MSKQSILLMAIFLFISACSSVDGPLDVSTSQSDTVSSSDTVDSDLKEDTASELRVKPEADITEDDEFGENTSDKSRIQEIILGDHPTEMIVGGKPYTPKAKLLWTDGHESEGVTFSVEDSDVLRKEGAILYAQRPGKTTILFRSLRDSSIKNSLEMTVLESSDLPGPTPIIPLSTPVEKAYSVLNKYYLDYQVGMSWVYTIRYAGARFAFHNQAYALPNTILLSKKMILENAFYDDIYDRLDKLFIQPNQTMGTYHVMVTDVAEDSVTIATELKSNSTYISGVGRKEKTYFSFDIGTVFDGVLEDALRPHDLAMNSQKISHFAKHQVPAVSLALDEWISNPEAIYAGPSKSKELISYYIHQDLGVIQKRIQTHHEYSQLSLDSQIIMDLTDYSSGIVPVMSSES